MNAFEALISRTLAKRIRAEIEDRGTTLMTGVATSYDDYKGRTGYIRALSDVLMWMAEAEHEVTNPEDKKNAA